jgi:hypothetical protein
MTCHDFRNALARLRNLDRDELVQAGAFGARDEVLWLLFQRDPVGRFLGCPDDMAEAIWSLIRPCPERMVARGTQATLAEIGERRL